MKTQAQVAIERYIKRGWRNFNPSRGRGVAKLEKDPSLPYVSFYRWPDGSVARLDLKTGDVTA